MLNPVHLLMYWIIARQIPTITINFKTVADANPIYPYCAHWKIKTAARGDPGVVRKTTALKDTIVVIKTYINPYIAAGKIIGKTILLNVVIVLAPKFKDASSTSMLSCCSLVIPASIPTAAKRNKQLITKIIIVPVSSKGGLLKANR